MKKLARPAAKYRRRNILLFSSLYAVRPLVLFITELIIRYNELNLASNFVIVQSYVHVHLV